MAIQSRHTLAHCAQCECDMVRCATCDNNCCNGGYGEVNGEKCPDCPEAYDHQEAYWLKNDNVRFAKDSR